MIGKKFSGLPERTFVSLSATHPLYYLALYLFAIPIYALFYVLATPGDFYAPYSKYEPGARTDTTRLSIMLETATRRYMEEQKKIDFIVGKWKLDIASLRVDDIKSNDGTQLSFRVRLNAQGIDELSGIRQYGWAVITTVQERPSAVELRSGSDSIYYRKAEYSPNYDSPDKALDEELFQTIFCKNKQGFAFLEPTLALNQEEEFQFEHYFLGIKGDASAVTGHLARMMYLSAVVITTLGLGDIIPLTSLSRLLVALEAVTGVVFAGLFLNALAYRASKSNA